MKILRYRYAQCLLQWLLNFLRCAPFNNSSIPQGPFQKQKSCQRAEILPPALEISKKRFSVRRTIISRHKIKTFSNKNYFAPEKCDYPTIKAFSKKRRSFEVTVIIHDKGIQKFVTSHAFFEHLQFKKHWFTVYVKFKNYWKCICEVKQNLSKLEI